MNKLVKSKIILLLALFIFSNLALADKLNDDYELKHQTEKEIVLITPTEEIVINDDFPSQPEIGPNKDKFVFISPFIWEQIGQVCLYELERKESEVILKREDLPPQTTPKVVKWLNEESLLLIIGNAYGTITVGGDLYLFDLREGELEELSNLADEQEYKDIKFSDDEIIFKLATFDENHLNYEISEKTYSIKDFIESLN